MPLRERGRSRAGLSSPRRPSGTWTRPTARKPPRASVAHGVARKLDMPRPIECSGEWKSAFCGWRSPGATTSIRLRRHILFKSPTHEPFTRSGSERTGLIDWPSRYDAWSTVAPVTETGLASRTPRLAFPSWFLKRKRQPRAAPCAKLFLLGKRRFCAN
jgi:hypothetical protein